MVGCARREKYDLIKYTFLVPVYWLMMNISAWTSLYEFIAKPFYWAKTQHGEPALNINIYGAIKIRIDYSTLLRPFVFLKSRFTAMSAYSFFSTLPVLIFPQLVIKSRITTDGLQFNTESFPISLIILAVSSLPSLFMLKNISKVTRENIKYG